jgi:hypothetical protein
MYGLVDAQSHLITQAFLILLDGRRSFAWNSQRVEARNMV